MQQALWWVLSKSLRKPLTPVITVSGLIRPGQSSPFELREAREAESLVKEQFSAGDETDAVSSTSGQSQPSPECTIPKNVLRVRNEETRFRSQSGHLLAGGPWVTHHFSEPRALHREG